MEQLNRQIKMLRIYVTVLTIVVIGCIVALVGMWRRGGQPSEITAQRINIVEPDGRLALVISNHARQHPGRMDGKDFPVRERAAGMIFFNQEGDECGGLVYDGTKASASLTFSVDQYKNDQIMQLQYQQDSGQHLTRSYGLKLWDESDRFPLRRALDYFDSLRQKNDTAATNAAVKALREKGYLITERLFLGRTRDGNTGLFLRDDKGIPRLRIYINKQNEPLIETLNEKGEVVSSARLDKR